MSTTVEQPLVRQAAGLTIVGLVIAGLYLGRELFIPFTLAVFLSFLLAPAVRAIERLRVGRVVAVVLVVSASLGAIGAVGWVVASQASALIDELPQYRGNIRTKVQQLRRELTSRFHRASEVADGIHSEVNRIEPRAAGPSPQEFGSPVEAILGPAPVPDAPPEKPVKVEVVGSQEGFFSTLANWASPVVDPLATLGVAGVFVFFFLTFREDLRDRLVRACGQTRIQVTTATVTDSAVRVARYFAALALANLIIGAAIGAGFYLIGVPKAVLWGLLAAVLRFIPYVGALIAAIFPATLSAAIFDGWAQAVLVVGWTIVADVAAANFLEPWLLGARVGASPTAIVVSFVFWSWLWGGIGFLLATPITVCLIVLGKHVPAFEPFYVLLGNEPVLEPKLRLYQRMLSSNRIEATAVVRQYAETASLLEVYDTLVFPALAQLEHDRHAGLIDSKRVEAAREIVAELLTWSKTAQPHQEDQFIVPAKPGAPLLVLPDRGAFDECVPEVLRHVARARTDHWEVIPAAALASEVAERVADSNPSALVFLAIEPLNVDRVRHIHRRLASARIACDIHVGLFSVSPRGQSHRRRLQRLQGVRVATSLGELAAAIGGLELRERPTAASVEFDPRPRRVAVV